MRISHTAGRDRARRVRERSQSSHDGRVIEPEPPAPPQREAVDDTPVVRQDCGPYRLDFYATADAVVCVVHDAKASA